jgi:TetR/AcrR family transcriptional regulator, transcriptional repressor for nem operon
MNPVSRPPQTQFLGDSNKIAEMTQLHSSSFPVISPSYRRDNKEVLLALGIMGLSSLVIILQKKQFNSKDLIRCFLYLINEQSVIKCGVVTGHSSEKRDASDRGRPREFDPDVAIAAAAKVFWDKGYHATSVDDLCESTGLLRGSLYSAFGDKKGMLLAALDQYAEKNLTRLAESLSSAGSSREVLHSALLYYTRAATVLAGRHGCLVTNTALEMLPHDPDVEERVERVFRRMLSLLTAAVIRGQAAGVFNPDLDERTVGHFLLCLILGLRVLGKTRSHGEKELGAIVDLVMKTLS